MIFETKRCIIKTITLEDKQDLFSLSNDINVWKYLGGEGTAQWHRKNIETLENLPSEFFSNRWIIRDKTNNRFVGYTSMGIHHDGEYMELAYMLLSVYWGYGYATEVASEIVRYAFNEKGISRLLAEVQSANLASRHVLEKLCF